MLSKIPFRIAGAAMLGTVALLGTNAANAAINLDATSTVKRDPAITYAMETVTTMVTGKDGGTYYEVSNTNSSMDVYGKIGVGGVSGTVRTVTFTLHGMVFTADSAPALRVGVLDTQVVSDACATAAGAATSLRTGGAAGDSKVSFILDGTDVPARDATAIACLDVAELAVSANGGGVSMKVADNLADPAMHESTYPGAVGLSTALAATRTAMEAKTFVADKYKTLGAMSDTEGMAYATVGKVAVSMMTDYHAAGGTRADEDVTMEDLFVASDTEAANDAARTTSIPSTESTVTFMGDFSFASMVTMDDDMDCMAADADGTADASPPTGDLRMAEVNGVRDTTKLKPQPLGAMLGTLGNEDEGVSMYPGMYLCIHVLDKEHRDAMAIPEAGPYMAMFKFAGGTTDAKHPAMPMTLELGKITRDGTNVRIPFVTVNERHHQRIVIMNRGGEAFYDMTFMVEDGRTAMPGADASGMLPAGKVTVLSLRNDDVVTVDGGTRTSANLSIEAEPSNISVSTIIHSPDTGNTDTVVIQE